MLVKSLLALAVASVAAAQNASDYEAAINAIPASCDGPCATYKNIFENCPGNSNAQGCAQACNGTIALELISCINCTQIEGPPTGVTVTQIDLLNLAQQHLAQQCIDGGHPATFTGQVVTPSSVPLPPGVSSTVAPKPSTTANSTAASSAASAAASQSAKAGSSAGALLAPAAGVLAAVAGVLAVL
ncbi:hypothetical protein Q8F55_003340 [Vanrija albida]|uniref:Extracellular membrane protein CFEM domain-containing protein n=1 Tax=Vanrija albida TaxID=181172 RepID=A0ABR3Q3N1_9TREE